MLKPICFWLTVLAGIVSWSQYVQYAPDVRWADDVKTSIGLANPTKLPAAATLTGYSSIGVQTGTRSLEIPGLGRREFTAYELFNTAETSYLVLQSSVELGAYVLFKGQNTLSTAPFTSSPGSQLFVPHVARNTSQFYTETVVANYSSSRLPAFSQAFYDDEDEEATTPLRFEEGISIPSAGDQMAHSSFMYSDLYDELTPLLQWDIISSSEEQGFAGVEHFGKTGQQRASLTLQRSPFQELIISHLSQDREHFWSGLVLVNTKDGIVPISIQSYLEDGTPFQKLHLEMQPFEKKTFLIGEEHELGISDIASWLKVTPFEQAIIGYQVFGSPDQTFMAGLEPAMIPTNMTVLPFTPTDEEHWSGFGMINPTDEDICVQIGGLDDEGNIVGWYDCKRMDPHSKFTTTLKDFFGDKAEQITWVRLNTERGTMSAFSLVGDHERSTLAGLQGISTYSKEGTVFLANFEHDSIQTLVDQGWQETQFEDIWQWQWRNHFSIESYYEAVNGLKHLQVAKFPQRDYFWGFIDQVAFVSPYFEIPADKENLFLSFYLRMIDPENTNPFSHYGVVWREEGSSAWNWHGLTGTHILDELENNEDFTVLQKWNLEIHQMTHWLPFELQLPSSLAGKRIQIGLWYESPNEYLDPEDPTPYLWADLIRVTTEPLIPWWLNTRVYNGHGVFFFDLP